MFRIKVEQDCYPGRIIGWIDLLYVSKETAERVAEEVRGSKHHVTATVIDKMPVTGLEDYNA